MSENSEDPKIIIDEDWKDKVRAEREAARTARQTEPEEAAGQQPPPGEPDAFAILISSLATQTMMALGQIPDPSQGHAVVRPELAKHSIDTLAMLEGKTKGNLSPAEETMLSDVLHQLRMLFVAVYKAPNDTAGSETLAEQGATAGSETRGEQGDKAEAEPLAKQGEDAAESTDESVNDAAGSETRGEEA